MTNNNDPFHEHTTPFLRHEDLRHKVTAHSPNGVDRIEECDECPARFLWNPAIGYWVSLPPKGGADA